MLNNESDPTSGGPSGPGATSTPWTPDELSQAQAWAQQYYTSHKIPNAYGTANDLVSQYQQQRAAGLDHNAAMQQAPTVLGWDKYAPNVDPGPTPGPVTPPPVSGPGNQTPPDIMNAPLTKPFQGTFTAPPPVNLGGPAGIPYVPPTPTFTGADAPPQLGDIPKFQAPSVADALNDPGYQFRVGQGEDALQNWAAARGTLNDSSTAKALTDYGQGAASQEYANVFDRALNTYGTNLQSQYALPYQANSQNWMAGIVNPRMLGYSTQAAAGGNQNTLNYQNAWNAFLNNENQYNSWQDRAWNKIFQSATA